MKLKVHEVGLRDGLQNEKQIVTFEKKLEWAEKLANSGIDILQLGSFVNPQKVPQMADTDKLFESFKNINHQALLSGLLLNEKGMERAVGCGVELYCMGVSASVTHSKKNTGMTTDEALLRIIAIAKELQDNHKQVQVSIQSAFGCGFEGKIDEIKVVEIAGKYIENGLLNISLADTAGHAYPEQVKRLISSVKNIEPKTIITVHFHNTYGLGMANCYAAMSEGADVFETAFAGLGGCPFTKVVAGNVSTEDFVSALNRNNLRNDIYIDTVIEISKDAETVFGRKMESYVLNAGRLNYLR